MSHPAPISVRLDPEVRAVLEDEAAARGTGLSSLLRELAAQAARDIRRARIRAQSAAVGAHAAHDPEAGAFYSDWGNTRPEG
jgi:uncharacterized protein (DUF1778 family)